MYLGVHLETMHVHGIGKTHVIDLFLQLLVRIVGVFHSIAWLHCRRNFARVTKVAQPLTIGHAPSDIVVNVSREKIPIFA